MDNAVLERPSTPNTVMYEDDYNPGLRKKSLIMSRPATGQSLKAPATYHGPMSATDRGEDAQSVGGAGGQQPQPRIWTIENDYDDDPERADATSMISFDEEKILLEKEFDDYYEERVHKSAGPVVFISKMLGMIPVIWTEDESESECKSYFNLYTFVIFLGN